MSRVAREAAWWENRAEGGLTRTGARLDYLARSGRPTFSREPAGAGTPSGAVAQLVRVPDCRSGGCGFESRPPRFFRKSRDLWSRLFFLRESVLQPVGLKLVGLRPPPVLGRAALGSSSVRLVCTPLSRRSSFRIIDDLTGVIRVARVESPRDTTGATAFLRAGGLHNLPIFTITLMPWDVQAL